MPSHSRRTFLAAAAATTTALAGCLSGSPDCGNENVAVVYRSQLRGWYVSYPASTGLFDSNEQGEQPMERLVALARERGYTAEYYFAEDYGRRGDDDEWQAELYGELDRDTVEKLVTEANMPEKTTISERTASLSRGSGLKFPWDPGLLGSRANFIAEFASNAGVSAPPFGPFGDKVVTLSRSIDAERQQWLQTALAERSVLRVDLKNVPDEGNPLHKYSIANYDEYDDVDAVYGHDRNAVRVTGEGHVETGLYHESMLDAVYRPGDEEQLKYLDDAVIEVRLNDVRIEKRPLTDAEREFLQAYQAYIASYETSDREAPEAPRLVLTTLDARDALRVATALRWPTDARFGVGIEECG